MRNILFFDVDGTLLDETGRVPESILPTFQKLRDQGDLLFVNSGRTMFDLEQNPGISELGFDGYISGCGSQIRYHGENLRNYEVSKTVYRLLISEARRLQLELMLEGEQGVYFDTTLPFCEPRKNLSVRLAPYSGDIDAESICFQKFLCWGERSAMEEFARAFINVFTPIYKGDGCGEFVPCGYDKGEAMEFLLQYFGISKDNCYAFGDSENDISMLKAAKHSILIGEGSKELQSLVEYISQSAKEDGVKNAIIHYGLIGDSIDRK